MNERMKKAEYLLSEMSGIDERIVAEALTVRKKSGSNTRRAVILLVAAMLLVSVTVGSFLIGSFANSQNGDNAAPSISPTLDSVLTSGTESSRVLTYGSAEEVDLFGGETRIVWSEGEEYHAITLRGKSECSRLDGALKASYKAAETVEDGADYDCKVWISYGDGRVVSPYLKDSVGNVGYGELFDYEAEIMPTEAFTEFVGGLIS